MQATLQLQAPYQLGLVSLKREVEGDLVPLQLADRHLGDAGHALQHLLYLDHAIDAGKPLHHQSLAGGDPGQASAVLLYQPARQGIGHALCHLGLGA